MTSNAGRAHGFMPSVAVLVVAFSTFAAAIPNQLLGDDTALVLSRLNVVRISDLLHLLGESYWGELHPGGAYRPLSLILLGLQRLAFGVDPAPFHIVGLILHGACSLLVLLVLGRFCTPVGALFGALLFAAHPVHAEAVATVYGQEDLWAALFLLVALQLYLKDAIVSGMVLPVICCSYLFSLLCKEQGILLPGILVIVRGLWIYPERNGWRRWVGRTEASLALPLVFYAGLRLYVLGYEVVPTGEAAVAFGYPWWAHANLVIVTTGTYLRLLVLPWGQTTYYGHLRESIFGIPVVELAAIFTALAGVCLLLRSPDRRIFTVGIGFLVLTLLPVANLLPIGTVVGERCLYLPSVALCLLAGALCGWLYQRRKKVALALIGAATVAGIAASQRVTHQWRTPLSHWEATVASHPDSPRAQAVYALLLLQEISLEGMIPQTDPRLVRAENAFDTALLLNPRSPEAWQGRGLLAIMRGDCAAAQSNLHHALALRRNDVFFQQLLGSVKAASVLARSEIAGSCSVFAETSER